MVSSGTFALIQERRLCTERGSSNRHRLLNPSAEVVQFVVLTDAIVPDLEWPATKTGQNRSWLQNNYARFCELNTEGLKAALTGRNTGRDMSPLPGIIVLSDAGSACRPGLCFLRERLPSQVKHVLFRSLRADLHIHTSHHAAAH